MTKIILIFLLPHEKIYMKAHSFIASHKNLYENVDSLSFYFVAVIASLFLFISLFNLTTFISCKFFTGDSSVPDLAQAIIIISGKVF